MTRSRWGWPRKLVDPGVDGGVEAGDRPRRRVRGWAGHRRGEPTGRRRPGLTPGRPRADRPRPRPAAARAAARSTASVAGRLVRVAAEGRAVGLEGAESHSRDRCGPEVLALAGPLDGLPDGAERAAGAPGRASVGTVAMASGAAGTAAGPAPAAARASARTAARRSARPPGACARARSTGARAGLVVGDDQLAVVVELEPVDDAAQPDAVDLGLELQLEPDGPDRRRVLELEVVRDQLGGVGEERGLVVVVERRGRRTRGRRAARRRPRRGRPSAASGVRSAGGSRTGARARGAPACPWWPPRSAARAAGRWPRTGTPSAQSVNDDTFDGLSEPGTAKAMAPSVRRGYDRRRGRSASAQARGRRGPCGHAAPGPPSGRSGSGRRDAPAGRRAARPTIAGPNGAGPGRSPPTATVTGHRTSPRRSNVSCAEAALEHPGLVLGGALQLDGAVVAGREAVVDVGPQRRRARARSAAAWPRSWRRPRRGRRTTGAGAGPPAPRVDPRAARRSTRREHDGLVQPQRRRTCPAGAARP